MGRWESEAYDIQNFLLSGPERLEPHIANNVEGNVIITQVTYAHI